MRSGGRSFGRIGPHVGSDSWTFLNTHDDHPHPRRRRRGPGFYQLDGSGSDRALREML
jgi:hypothetical protein